MSISRPQNPTKQMIEYWKAKKAQMKAAQQSPETALKTTNIVEDARFLRNMTTQTVKLRIKVALIDQTFDQLSQDWAGINLRINTLKDLASGNLSLSYDHLKQVAGKELKENEATKLKSIIKSFSEKQSKELTIIQDGLTAIRMLATGMLDKDFESNKKRLEKASVKLSKMVTMALTSNHWAFSRASKHLYTHTLGIKVKEFINPSHRSTAAKSPEEIKKAQDKALKRLMDQLIGFASHPDHSSSSKLFKKRIQEHQSKLKELINLGARSKNNLLWEQPQAFYQFLKLISQDNLSAYLKSQNEERKTSSNSLADTKREVMDKHGLKTGLDQLEIIKLANALFEGDKGQQMKKVLRQSLLRYSIYNGLLDMVAKNSVAEREQVFNQLYADIRKTTEGLKVWHAFFQDHASLNLGPRFAKNGGPVGSETLWAFREALAGEKHPIFEILQNKVNSLYHSFKRYSKLELQLPSVTASPLSSQPPSPRSTNRASFFSSVASSAAPSATDKLSKMALEDNTDYEREGSVFYLN